MVVDAAHVIVLLYVSVSLVGMFSHICFDTSVGVFHNGFSYNLLNCGYGLWNGAKNNMLNTSYSITSDNQCQFLTIYSYISKSICKIKTIFHHFQQMEDIFDVWCRSEKQPNFILID